MLLIPKEQMFSCVLTKMRRRNNNREKKNDERERDREGDVILFIYIEWNFFFLPYLK